MGMCVYQKPKNAVPANMGILFENDETGKINSTQVSNMGGSWK